MRGVLEAVARFRAVMALGAFLVAGPEAGPDETETRSQAPGGVPGVTSVITTLAARAARVTRRVCGLVTGRDFTTKYFLVWIARMRCLGQCLHVCCHSAS